MFHVNVEYIYEHIQYELCIVIYNLTWYVRKNQPRSEPYTHMFRLVRIGNYIIINNKKKSTVYIVK